MFHNVFLCLIFCHDSFVTRSHELSVPLFKYLLYLYFIYLLNIYGSVFYDLGSFSVVPAFPDSGFYGRPSWLPRQEKLSGQQGSGVTWASKAPEVQRKKCLFAVKSKYILLILELRNVFTNPRQLFIKRGKTANRMNVSLWEDVVGKFYTGSTRL